MQPYRQPPQAALSPTALTQARRQLPGLFLLASITAASLAICSTLRGVTLSPLIVALVIGVAVRNLMGIPRLAAGGIRITSRYALRTGVVVLGLQLSLGQIVSMGAVAALIVGMTLVATFFVTLRLGARLGVEPPLTQLIAAGTSICGASAIIAANTVARGTDEDVAYAVATVSIFGSASVLLYPIAGHLLQMTPETYGLWSGASIHEIGQVAAAADVWPGSSDVAMIAKLSRVMLLAPIVLLLATLAGPSATGGSARLDRPWFLLGFVVMMLIGSVGYLPPEYKQWGAHVAALLLTVALAGLGLDLDLRQLRTRGWRPLLLGTLSTAFICISSLTAILLWK